MIKIKELIDVNFEKLTDEIQSSSIVSKYISIVDYDNDTNEVHIDFTEDFSTADDVVLDGLISSHDSTPSEEPLQSVYSKREIEGVLYYREIQSKLAKDYLDGVNDFATTRTIENKLQTAVALLRSGNWMSAKDELENNVATDEADLTAVLKASIISDMDDYITNNY